jgi:hypothetical protein
MSTGTDGRTFVPGRGFIETRPQPERKPEAPSSSQPDPFAQMLGARMDMILHGPPKDRRLRKQLRSMLGEIEPEKAENAYDPMRW